MVAALVLGTSVVRRVGSSPTWGTKLEDEEKVEIFSWVSEKENFYD